MARWKKSLASTRKTRSDSFAHRHFSRIARVLRTQRPLYLRDLMAEKQRRLPLIPALRSYLSLKSAALRNAARISVMLSIASLMGSALHLPKPYWIMMTIMFVTQNGYGATRVRIVHRAAGTLAGLMIAGIALHFHVPLGFTLAAMLLITLISYLIIRKNYGWAMVGFTITAVYTLQLLTLNGEEFIVARLIDTLLGCLIAFGGMVWLWPQWQSGLLRQNAHDALETYQEAIRLILSDSPQPTPLAPATDARQSGAQCAVQLTESGHAGAGVQYPLSGGHEALGDAQPVYC